MTNRKPNGELFVRPPSSVIGKRGLAILGYSHKPCEASVVSNVIHENVDSGGCDRCFVGVTAVVHRLGDDPLVPIVEIRSSLSSRCYSLGLVPEAVLMLCDNVSAMKSTGANEGHLLHGCPFRRVHRRRGRLRGSLDDQTPRVLPPSQRIRRQAAGMQHIVA